MSSGSLSLLLPRALTLTLHRHLLALNQTAEGQLAHKPRLQIDKRAGERCALESIAAGEFERGRAEWAARAAHRLGWVSNQMF